MSVRSPRRFLGGLALIFLTVGMLAVFAMAVASVLYITGGSGLGREVSAEAPTSDGDDDDLTTPLAPTARIAVNDAGIGSVACEQSPSSAVDPPPYVVSLLDVDGGPDPIAIEVRLTRADGASYLDVVEFSASPMSETVLPQVVPNSFDPELTSCSVTAIQRGRRVLLTGR